MAKNKYSYGQSRKLRPVARLARVIGPEGTGDARSGQRARRNARQRYRDNPDAYGKDGGLSRDENYDRSGNARKLPNYDPMRDPSTGPNGWYSRPHETYGGGLSVGDEQNPIRQVKRRRVKRTYKAY